MNTYGTKVETPWGISGVEILRLLTNEVLPVSEQQVKLGALQYMTGDERETFDDNVRRARDLATTIRTGGLFIFDVDDLPSPADVREMMGHPATPEPLPPMPFPRMWFEIEGMPFPFKDIDGTNNIVLGWGLYEKTQGSEWKAFMSMIDRDKWLLHMDETDPYRIPSSDFAIREYSLKYDTDSSGVYRRGISMGEPDVDLMEAMPEDEQVLISEFMGTPLWLIQLVHVLGVSIDTYPIHRARKREFQRKTGLSFPQLYFINLRSAGDSHPYGNGDREYRHRWLVRGHYRKQEKGEFFLPSKGSCTWVRPYIKGPPGAPWKGRGVYRSRSEDD